MSSLSLQDFEKKITDARCPKAPGVGAALD
jgi:hypothetical protein